MFMSTKYVVQSAFGILISLQNKFQLYPHFESKLYKRRIGRTGECRVISDSKQETGCVFQTKSCRLSIHRAYVLPQKYGRCDKIKTSTGYLTLTVSQSIGDMNKKEDPFVSEVTYKHLYK